MNGRPLSQFIRKFFESRAALDARAYNTHLAFRITLSSGAQIDLSTEPLLMTSMSKRGESVTLEPPIFFQGKVLTAPDIQFTQTDANDGGTTFTVSNLDYLLSALIPENERLFDGAQVTVYLCFPKGDGGFEGLIYGIGNLRTSEGDHEFAPISYVSDLSDKSVTAGGRDITQKCLNILGVMSGRSWCGATGLAVGATCSKVYDDDENGCAFYGMQSQFQGVPFFNPNGLVANYGGTVTGGGWGQWGGTGCFDVGSYFKTPSGAVRGRELKRGDALVNHLGQVAVVNDLKISFAEYRYLMKSSAGARAIVSASHLTLVSFDDDKGVAVYSLTQGNTPTSDGNGAIVWRQQVDSGIITPDGEIKIVADINGRAVMTEFALEIAPSGEVLELELSDPKTYCAGQTPDKYFGAHNKPIYNDLPIYGGSQVSI
jgi:hypothetical protein